jgi:carbohydrate esterase-like sialic acid-specific acetylesterase
MPRAIGLGIGTAYGPFSAGGTTLPAATFTVVQEPLDHQTFQRDTLTGGGQSKGQGAVTVPEIDVTVGGTIYARCRSADDGTTILQAKWLAIEDASVADGPLDIPGVDARLGFFYLDLSGDGSTWTNGTVPIAMGMVGLLSGQSLMVRMFATQEDATTITGAGATVPANGRVFSSIEAGGDPTPSSWRQPDDATDDLPGAGVCELMNLLIAAAGVNVGIVSRAVGATAITEWLPGQTLGDELLDTADAGGGKYEFVWWYQGHTNSSISSPDQQADLTTLLSAIDAHNGFPSPVILISSIPNQSGYGNVETTRYAYYTWAVNNGAIPLVFNDLEMAADYVHPIQVGAMRQARHAYRALRPHLGLSHDDKGAVCGAATHASGSKDIVVPLTWASGATTQSAVGSPHTRIEVFAYGDRSSAKSYDGTTPFALDNTARAMTLKLASDPGQIGLEGIFRRDYSTTTDGSANNIYDDVTDGDGISTGRQLYMPPRLFRILPNRDLTTTGASYGPGGKFGNTMTAGYGTSPYGVFPTENYGMTLEFWHIINSTEGLSVLLSSSNLWIGVDTNTLKLSRGGSTADAGTLSTGSQHHIAFFFGDTNYGQVDLWIDGVAQAPISGGGYPTGSVLNVRHLGGSFTPTTQNISEIGITEGKKYPTGNFTPPSAASNGSTEVALYHLSDATNSAA